jgi:hypothetical protein
MKQLTLYLVSFVIALTHYFSHMLLTSLEVLQIKTKALTFLYSVTASMECVSKIHTVNAYLNGFS